jgi:anti-anti-sigma regulatory factor
MSTLFSVSVIEEKGVSILFPEGYIDEDAVEGFQDAFNQVRASGNTRVLISFKKTRKINSTGMSYILNLLQESINLGIRVRFSDLSRINQKLFSMIGIDEYGEIFPDEAAALDKF